MPAPLYSKTHSLQKGFTGKAYVFCLLRFALPEEATETWEMLAEAILGQSRKTTKQSKQMLEAIDLIDPDDKKHFADLKRDVERDLQEWTGQDTGI
jgi:hypothetical protein